MSESLNATLLRPAPHPRSKLRRARACKLEDMLPAEEAAWLPAWPSYEDMRLALARRRALFSDRWRGCPERLCKRHRHCVQARLDCPRMQTPLPRPMTREDRALYDCMWLGISAARAARAGK